MKLYGLILYLGMILVIVGCSTDNPNERDDEVNGTWNLTNVSGGFAGIDDDFEKGQIVWKFDANDGMLTVVNNDESNTIFNGVSTGTYSYSVLQQKGKYYLLVNDQEFGEVSSTQSKLILDQNSVTSGSGADGFVLSFER